MSSQGRSAWAEQLLLEHWWRPQRSWLSWLLLPVAVLYGVLTVLRRLAYRHHVLRSPDLPVPVVVIGNLVVGGAGKTPTVIALVKALQAEGWHPAVLSRGYLRGRAADGREADAGLSNAGLSNAGLSDARPSDAGQPGGNSGTKQAASAGRAVQPQDAATAVGDEPLLIRRRTGVPVWVGRERGSVARALCARHPEVDVLLSDDGLQHHALQRCAEWVVFDQRGAGNGCLLPAGPLREPLRSPPLQPATWRRVLYAAAKPSTALPGYCAQRHVREAWPLAAWWAQDHSAVVPLHKMLGPVWLAAAGIAAPQKFFDMLRGEGLQIQELALPDHCDFSAGLPWPASCKNVLVTEKDAVKLKPQAMGSTQGSTQIWVVPLDLQLPSELVAELVLVLKSWRRS